MYRVIAIWNLPRLACSSPSHSHVVRKLIARAENISGSRLTTLVCEIYTYLELYLLFCEYHSSSILGINHYQNCSYIRFSLFRENEKESENETEKPALKTRNRALKHAFL
jgi:hypothetical protein